jgi:multiple sugar transport system substrate-binding protein
MESKTITRRGMLKGLGLMAAGGLMAACAPSAAKPAAQEGAAEPAKAEEKAPVAGAAGGEVEIVFVNTASSDSSEQLYKPIYEEFRKAHPEIKVKWAGVVPEGGWGSYFDKLAVMIAGGQTVDIAKIPTEGGRLAVARDLVVPLDDFIAATPELKDYMADVSPDLAKVFVYGGKTYGLPYDYNNMMIWFNTKRLQEVGLDMPKEDWTFGDLTTYAQALTQRNGDQVTHWGFQFWIGPFGLCPWLFNNGLEGIMGGAALDKPLVNDPKFVEVIQYLYDLIYTHKVAPRLDAELSAKFEEGTVGMMMAGRWPISGFIQNKFEDYEVQYWPKGTRRVTEVGCGSWPIFKASQHKNEAWTFETWLLKKESVSYMVSQGANIPSRRSIGYSEDFVKLPKNSGKLWYESIDRKDIPVMSVTSPPEFSEMEQIVNRHLTKVFANEAQIPETLEACQKELEAMVAKRPPEWAKVLS